MKINIEMEFKKGDFIKNKSYYTDNVLKFAIFEGTDLAKDYVYLKKYSLALFYSPKKYVSTPEYSGYKEVFEIATKDKKCNETVDTAIETAWWTICTEEEKKEAIEIINKHGYDWNEELMSIVDIETREIIYHIPIPKIEYNGELIIPNNKLKNKLKKYIMDKSKTSNHAASSYQNYDDYENYYGYNGKYWD